MIDDKRLRNVSRTAARGHVGARVDAISDGHVEAVFIPRLSGVARKSVSAVAAVAYRRRKLGGDVEASCGQLLKNARRAISAK